MPKQCRPPGHVFFQEYILKYIGERTDFKHGVFIPRTTETFREIIRMVGLNPDKLSQYGDPAVGWCWEGVAKPMGMRRRIAVTYHSMYQKSVHLTISGERKQWALTQIGAEVALRQHEDKDIVPPKGNLTSQFLNKRIKESQGGLLRKMRKKISYKLVFSERCHLVDDYVQNCLLRMIARDSLKSRIKLGFPIEDYHITAWALRSALTDVRNQGTEPIHRELHWAKTSTERKNGAKRGTLSDPCVLWESDKDGQVQRSPEIKDLGSSFNITNVEDAIQFNDIWGQVTEIIDFEFPNSPDYLKAFQMHIEGATYAEVAQGLCIPKHKATSLIRDARDVVGDQLYL